MGRTISGLFITLGSLSILPGCMSTAYIADYATEYNKAVEKTNNEELLLNILRASKRRPTYFTYITTVRGGPGLNLGSGQLSIPFGEGATGLAAKTLSGTVGYSGTSGFDIGVVDTQEFMRGYTTPVDIKTFGYYWSQSWPPELLWTMFVKKIEVDIVSDSTAGFKAPELRLLDWATAGNRQCDPDLKPHCEQIHEWTLEKGPDGKEIEKDFVRKVYTFTNYPEDEPETRRFLALSRKLIGPDFHLAPARSQGEAVGIPLDDNHAAAIEQSLIRAKNDVYSLKEDPGHKDHYVLKTNGELTLSYPGGCAAPKAPPSSGDEQKPAKIPATPALHSPAIPSPKGTQPWECKDAPQLSIYLRSPESMLYFLGEMARLELRGKTPVEVAMCKRPGHGDRDVQMIDIHNLDGMDGPFPISVEFDGHRYGVLPQTPQTDPIAECRQETTTQTLSLMSQVIALQKSAKDLPAIGVVHVSP